MERGEKLIMHVDVDAFFASVEQLLIPALRGKPVIVGSGCIASCSYEARRFGLSAGMALRIACKKCPPAVVLPGQYQIYRCFAEQVWEICRRFACSLETYLDEAYGDATEMAGRFDSPQQLGLALQQQAHTEVGLPVSVGLASNHMLAKIASGQAKPYGVRWVRPGSEAEHLSELPVAKLPGVGHVTGQRLTDMNINTIGELAELTRGVLESMFPGRGAVLYERCHGLDPRVIRPDALPKTISRETTFHKPTSDPHELAGMLFYLLERGMRAMRQLKLVSRRVDVSIRYDDWKPYSGGKTLAQATSSDTDAYDAVVQLFGRLHKRRVAIRHVGIVLSRLTPAGQAMLFEPPARTRKNRLQGTVDSLRDRFGHAAVVTGHSIDLLGKVKQNDYGFILRTPSLTK